MKLYSRRYYGDRIEQLNIDTFIQTAQNVISIKILSPYYSKRFLDDKFLSLIPENVRQECDVTIVVNGFAGNRLKEQIKELKELEDSLKNLDYFDVSIYLNTETPLFHPKLYRFETEDEIFWFVGSANASEAGFSRNEEILVQLKGNNHNIFDLYIERVIQNSKLYSDIEEPKIDCMIKFWRTGLIYYKPNANIQFTFSRLKIPEWVKRKLSGDLEPPPFTDPGEPWGPFNIKLAINIEEERQRIQARHSPLSIETCFGYWVPSKYKQQLDEKLYRVIERKKANFNEILESMEGFGKENLTKQFGIYIESVKNNLNAIYNSYPWEVGDRIAIKIDNRYHLGTVTNTMDSISGKLDNNRPFKIEKVNKAIKGVGKKTINRGAISDNELEDWVEKEFWRPPENINEQFDNFVERLFEILRDDNHVERASSPLISSTMPEIWSDPLAVDEFSKSFFEYVVYRINMRTKPLIIKSIQKKCMLEHIEYGEGVKRIIERYISYYGWSDDDWLDK